MQRITDKVFEGGRRGEEGGGGGVGIYGLALINSPCVDGAVLQKAFLHLTFISAMHIWLITAQHPAHLGQVFMVTKGLWND